MAQESQTQKSGRNKTARKQNKWASIDWKSSPFRFIREVHDPKNKQWLVEAKCKHCGSIKKYVKGNMLRARSCRCMRGQFISDRCTRHGHSRTSRHPASQTYNSWSSMIARCIKPGHKSYIDYGGRGITVCKKWRNSFESFLADMGVRPAGATLGRKNNDKGYYKRNCEWQTHKKQARNRRNSALVTFNGKTLCVSEWAETLGMERDVLDHRLKAGWGVQRAFTAIPRKLKNNRESTRNLTQWYLP